MINTLRAFVRDQNGSISVEAVIWMSGLVGIGTMVGQKIVQPLIDNAQAQAALNADSLALIQQALAVCSGGS
jgi:Flp pilus assembly pilin Flp